MIINPKNILGKFILVTSSLCIMKSVAQVPFSVDPGFVGPFQDWGITDIDFMDNGQILVAGQMRLYSDIALFWSGTGRLEPDGTYDTNFFTLPISSGAVRIWDDEFFYTTSGQGVARCFLADGSLDPEYQLLDLFNVSHLSDFHVFPDGKMWRGGSYSKLMYDDAGNQIASEPGYGLIQTLPNGLADPDFDHKRTMPGSIAMINELPDGRFMLSGSQTQYEEQAVGNILRVWPDGSLDTTFHSSVFWGVANKFYHYPDGRMLAFGFFATPEYPDDSLAVIRLHPNGSTDTSWPVIPFRHSSVFPGLARISGYLEFEPGKLIVVGDFISIGSDPAAGIAVVDTSGQVLWDYFTGADISPIQDNSGGEDHYLRGIEQAPDGSIYIYGAYHGFDDGSNDHPDQRMITRLYGLNVGLADRPGTEEPLVIWPNPGSDRIWFGEVAPADVRMYNSQGSKVLEKYKFDLRYGLDAGGLDPGLYTIVIHSDQGRTLTHKWVKQ